MIRFVNENALWLSDAIWRHISWSILFQVMACDLSGAKPLPEPMLNYCQLDPREYILMKFYLKVRCFHSRKCISKYRPQNGGHFVQASMRK